MFVCCECCVLSGRGLCDELITLPEESYRLWCVVVFDLENLKNEEAMTRVGSQRHSKKNLCKSSLRLQDASIPACTSLPVTLLNMLFVCEGGGEDCKATFLAA